MAGARVRKRRPFVVIVAIGIALIFVAGSAFGLYFSLTGGQSASSLLQKGQDALAAGDSQKAAEAFRKAAKLEPRNYVALVDLGVTLYSQGDKKQAAVYLQRALDINPNLPEKAQIEQMISEGK
jgi:Tfp pilus assembly protein PilF